MSNRIPDVLRKSLRAALISLPALAVAGPGAAQTVARSAAGQSAAAAFERLTVIGKRPAELTGGSASYLTREQLERFRHTDIHRALKQVPGLYVVEEDGFGLRPNIGLRGSGTDRNSRITVMEDGVLIAPAPYAAPSAYYFPTMARMSAVEIRKGSAAVRSGPRTTGGAINLISTPIPEGELAGAASVQAGTNSTVLGHVAIGGSQGQWGYLVEALRQDTDGFKHLDTGGATGYSLDDYRAKLRYTTGSGARFYQEVELKLGVTDQDGDETYMGLTLDDFNRDPYRRYAASALDNIRTDHDQAEIRHYVAFSDRLDLTTAVYHNEFHRNWFKVNNLSTASMSDVLENPATWQTEYGWLTGATSPDDAIVIRNNNRAYDSRGIQTIIGLTPAVAGSAGHDIEVGIRVHQDEENRLQDQDGYRMEQGSLVLTTDAAPGTQDNRLNSADAFSIYLHDEISFGRFIVTPGVRYESVDLTQRRWAATDPLRTGVPTALAETDFDEVIAGIGAVYEVSDRWILLAGAHKGFNSPSPGSTAQAERSMNYEFGARFGGEGTNAEFIAFYNDYDNLVGTCTASTGGSCVIGDQFSGGQVEMQGLELSGRHQWSLDRGLGIPVQIAYTWTDASFETAFASNFDEWGDVAAGDRLPWLPEHQLQAQVGVHANEWGINLTASYTDSMRVEAGREPLTASNSTGKAWIVDIAGQWTLTDNLDLFARVENVLDEINIVAWRPAGARPGRPRTALIGFNARF